MNPVDLQVERPLRDPADLVDEVLEVGAPIDRWAVAARLESCGVRDVDALLYGHRDVFSLAAAVHAIASARPSPGTAVAQPLPWPPRALRVARSCLRGAFFFLPLSIQLASLLVLGYSLWASQSFSGVQASMVALVIGLSFAGTAGITQAIGYLGPFFAAPGKHMLTERITYVLLGIGLAVALAVAGVLGVVNAATGSVTWQRFAVAGVYYGLLSAFWLSTAVLYMLRQYAAMLAATIAGIAVVGVVHDAAGAGLYVGHWLGILTAIGISLVWAARVLRSRARDTRGSLRLAQLPRRSVLLRLVGPYVLYGTLYFSFLFTDRLVGWSAGDHPFPIRFRTPYEVGLDWALLSVVPGMAFLEHVVAAFPAMSNAEQKRCSGRRIGAYNRTHAGFYLRHLAVIVLVLAGGALAGYVGLPALARLGSLGSLHDRLADPVTRSVFAWGVVGYGLLACALMNAVFLLGTSRPWPVIGALAPALAANLAVGSYLSREEAYWHSVIGLTAGAALFFFLTTVAVIRTLREADFAYYAAY